MDCIISKSEKKTSKNKNDKVIETSQVSSTPSKGRRIEGFIR